MGNGNEGDRAGEGFSRGVLDLASHHPVGLQVSCEYDPLRLQFWAPGNVELFILSHPPTQLYAIPFAKSATTGQHSPDNTRYAFLQLDDRLMVYRGADQPDMSVINPESDVWQHIKVSPPCRSPLSFKATLSVHFGIWLMQ